MRKYFLFFFFTCLVHSTHQHSLVSLKTFSPLRCYFHSCCCSSSQLTCTRPSPCSSLYFFSFFGRFLTLTHFRCSFLFFSLLSPFHCACLNHTTLLSPMNLFPVSCFQFFPRSSLLLYLSSPASYFVHFRYIFFFYFTLSFSFSLSQKLFLSVSGEAFSIDLRIFCRYFMHSSVT